MASHQSMTGQKSTLTKSNFLQPIIHIVNLMVWSDNVSLLYEIYILQVRIHSLFNFKSFWQDILSKTLPENKSFPSSALTTVLGYSTGTIGKIMFDKCLMFYCLIIPPPPPFPSKKIDVTCQCSKILHVIYLKQKECLCSYAISDTPVEISGPFCSFQLCL